MICADHRYVATANYQVWRFQEIIGAGQGDSLVVKAGECLVRAWLHIIDGSLASERSLLTLWLQNESAWSFDPAEDGEPYRLIRLSQVASA